MAEAFEGFVTLMRSVVQYFGLPLGQTGWHVWHLYAAVIVVALSVAWITSFYHRGGMQ